MRRIGALGPGRRAGIAAAALGVVLLGRGAAADRSRPVPDPADEETIAHVLGRIGYGPRPGDVARVRAMGLVRYLELQLHPERIADTALEARLARFETLKLTSRDIAARSVLPAIAERRARRAPAADGRAPVSLPDEDKRAARADPTGRPSPAQLAARQVLDELAQQKLLRAVYSERQLQEVLVDFWFNHFNVFAGKGAVRVYLIEYERDVIRPRVFGKFRDLLGAVAESPAMLLYLDNWLNAASTDAATPSGLPLQRFGLSRWPRWPARGSAAAQGLPRPRERGLNENYARELLELHTLGVDGGYTQQDVVEVARALTGWTIAHPREGGGFRFDPRRHDDGAKVVLGHRIAPGGGKGDGDRVLDILARHPSTARLIAAKLVRRFVADDPPPTLVERAAARFRETDGDLREVVRTILTAPEFFAKAARRAKVKTPLEFVASALRATGADVTDPRPLARAVADLGMPLYLCQSPAGWADRADAWVSASALAGRLRFASMLAAGRLPGTRLDLAVIAGSGDEGRVQSGDAARHLVDTLFQGAVSQTTRATLGRAERLVTLVALALGAPEFQRR